MEPVVIILRRECHYKAKPCRTCGKPRSNPIHRKKNVEEGKPFCKFARQLGCARCGAAKSDPTHLGAPESFNAFAGRDPNVYRSMVDRWSEGLRPLLDGSGLPRPLDGLSASGVVSFGDAGERDQGNHRVIIEKALGDALVRGGWLEADTWSRYTFGDLERREDGTNSIVLTLVPRVAAPDVLGRLALPV